MNEILNLLVFIAIQLAHFHSFSFGNDTICLYLLILDRLTLVRKVSQDLKNLDYAVFTIDIIYFVYLYSNHSTYSYSNHYHLNIIHYRYRIEHELIMIS